MPDEQSSYEHNKFAYEQNMRAGERAHDKADEFFHKVNDAAIAAGNLALRMALLLNGGAAISLLTFIGTLDHDKKPLVAGGLIWFAWGAAASVAAIALAYVTNFCMAGIAASKTRTWEAPYFQDTPATKIYIWLNRVFHFAAVIVGLASRFLFVCGMFAIKNSIAHFELTSQTICHLAPLTQVS